MDASEEEKDFSLISINYNACEKVVREVKRRNRYVNIPLHGRAQEDHSGNKNDNEELKEREPIQQDFCKNKKVVSFERILHTKNTEQDDKLDCVDRNGCVKISVFEKKKSDTLFLRKKKSLIFNENKYNKFMEAFKQQELKKIKNFHYVYKWKIALVILLILAITFTLIGLFIYYESSQVIEVNIDYNSEDTFKIFEMTHKMKQPVYVYYKITNFYSNFKNFLSDESQALVNDCKCKYIKTFEDIYKFRCINNIQTLPELNNDLSIDGGGGKKKITNLSSNKPCDINSLSKDEKEKKIFPCGLVSASIFNDKIRLSLGEKIFNIDKFPILNYYDLFSYIKKHKKYSSNYKVWLNTISPDYKSWFHPPMTSSFIKPYGVIFEDLEPGNQYQITFTQNTWPAKHWKAKKSFQLISLRAVGNSAYELAYSFFLLALIYIIAIIVILILVKSGYCKLGKTFSYCKMSTDNNATEQTFIRKKSTMKRAGNGTLDLSKKISRAHPDEEKNKSSSNERITKVISSPSRRCLCPLH
ncbi:hypothetical protein, conserved [Plasmodium gonderi]|uniref:LEM3/CDC50 family protein n=1 Tax=Plasmodium gonderi TaxID=77519 RepID=A0A1Y1JIR2_PLAGO|nr:hypothetical protein, conserved [Plasmodium gonderi]GAW79994.1 hypothetical protein, conserved [Plasmodium gonderi]